MELLSSDKLNVSWIICNLLSRIIFQWCIFVIVAVTMREVDSLGKRSCGALRIFGAIERLFVRTHRRSWQFRIFSRVTRVFTGAESTFGTRRQETWKLTWPLSVSKLSPLIDRFLVKLTFTRKCRIMSKMSYIESELFDFIMLHVYFYH